MKFVKRGKWIITSIRDLYVLNYRKLFKFSMMTPALADRILLILNSLRKCYVLSYFFCVFCCWCVFIILSVLSIDCCGVLSYFYPVLLFLGVGNGFEGRDFSKNADYYEELGGDGSRIAFYLRVSTRKQARDGRSIDAQKEAMERLVQTKKPSIVYGYNDPGKSGTDFDDRKLTEVIELAKAGLINEFWIAYIDRMGRNLLDMLEFLCVLWRSNVYIRTPEKLYNSDNLSDLLMIIIECYMSEKSNIERTERAINSKRRNFIDKKWNKTVVPLGYRKNDSGWLSIIEEWIPIIRDVYKYFIIKESYANISRRLNAKYKEIIIEPLSTARAKSILRDPIYNGKPEHYGAVVDDSSLKIVPDNIFNQIQDRLAKLESKQRKLRKKVPLRLLIERYGISALEFLDNICFHHKKCDGELVKNGPRKINDIDRQNFLCKKCGEQFWVPNQTQMKTIRENHQEKIETINPLKSTKKNETKKRGTKKEKKAMKNHKLDDYFSMS